MQTMEVTANAPVPTTTTADKLSALLTIGDMARRYNVTLRTLRFYEDRGLIAPLRHGNARFYDAAACQQVELILQGKVLGYTLAEIEERLLNSKGLAWSGAQAADVEKEISVLEDRRSALDQAIARLREILTERMEVSPAAGSAAA